MSECYLFKDSRLMIRDPHLGIHIEEDFTPLLIPEDLTPSEGLVIIKDEKGRVQRAYFEAEGKLEGQYHLYYPSGKIEAECFYSCGMLHGPSRFYSEKGCCLSETWFYNDQKEGKSKRYYLSGKLCSIEQFKGGTLHGIQQYYYEDGTLKSAIPYKGGVLEGAVTLYHPTGNKKRLSTFKNGFREGYDRMWSAQDRVMDEGKYEKGDPVGLHRRYYESGTLQEQRFYHAPNRCDRTEWDANGNIVVKGSFDLSMQYVEKNWKEGVEQTRIGEWKGGRICWRGDAH